MDKKLIGALKSTDASQRIKGIKQLVKEKHPDAPKILGSMYKNDPEQAVKNAAKVAFEELKTGKSKGKADTVRAQEAMEHAMSELIKENKEVAIASAAKAFQLNPALREDDYATGLASELTGLDRAEAVDKVIELASEVAPKKKWWQFGK